VDVHVQNWVHFLGMIDIAGSKNLEYVHVKIPQDYWEQLNTTLVVLVKLLPMILFHNKTFMIYFKVNYLKWKFHLIIPIVIIEANPYVQQKQKQNWGWLVWPPNKTRGTEFSVLSALSADKTRLPVLFGEIPMLQKQNRAYNWKNQSHLEKLDAWKLLSNDTNVFDVEIECNRICGENYRVP